MRKELSKLLSAISYRIYTLLDRYQSLVQPDASPENGSNVLLLKVTVYETS
jgi:hypothetical protein